MVLIEALPRELLEKIFNYLSDGHFLVCVVSTVSKRWRRVLGSCDSTYWTSRAVFYDQLRPGTGEWNIRRLAVDLPFHRDVAEATPSIINAKGNLSDGWLCYSISTDWENGAGWAIEAGDDDSPPCVASTYSPCFLSRSFDLRKLGADPNDAVLVDIDARFEVSTRFDCGGSIEVGVGTIPPILRGRRSLSPHTKVQLDFEPSNEWEWCDFKARGVCAPEGGCYYVHPHCTRQPILGRTLRAQAARNRGSSFPV